MEIPAAWAVVVIRTIHIFEGLNEMYKMHFSGYRNSLTYAVLSKAVSDLRS